MALGALYATLDQLKSYAGIGDTDDDAELTDALTAASRGIESVCHRQFNDAAAATARVYFPEHPLLAEVDDFHTVTGLVIKTDTSGDGTFDTTWASTDYELRPLNGISAGQPGWPWCEVWAVGTQLFPQTTGRSSVEVTARWGWAAVPAPVKSACLIVAEELFKLKDAPFGVAGFGDMGPLRVRENPMAMKKLAPYIRNPVLVA